VPVDASEAQKNPALVPYYYGNLTADRVQVSNGRDVNVVPKQAEAALKEDAGPPFMTFVRSVDALNELLDSDPYARFPPVPAAKRVVTFLRHAPAVAPKNALPLEREGARILCVRGAEAFGDYIPGPRGPVFMTLLERTFGKAITTRTWETVRKSAADPPAKPPRR